MRRASLKKENIENLDNNEDKKNKFFLSEDTQKSLKKLIPKISHEEVMSC